MMRIVVVQCGSDDGAYSGAADDAYCGMVIMMMMQMMIHAVRKVTMHIAYLSVNIRCVIVL